MTKAVSINKGVTPWQFLLLFALLVALIGAVTVPQAVAAPGAVVQNQSGSIGTVCARMDNGTEQCVGPGNRTTIGAAYVIIRPGQCAYVYIDPANMTSYCQPSNTVAKKLVPVKSVLGKTLVLRYR